MMSELKPCPFCGKEQMTDAQRGDSNVVPYTGGTRLCDTRGCNCVSRNWNNRPLEDALRAENAKLRAEIERLRKEIISWESTH